MRKKKLKEKSDFLNPSVLIVTVLLLFVIILSFNSYFIKPLSKENRKYEVSSKEQLELIMLTESFLRKNYDVKIDDSLIKDYDINTYGDKFGVAAEYYYYLNHDNLTEEVLTNYEEILNVAKKIYDTNNIVFTNFVVNIDDDNCGIKKYSSLEGIITNDSCDLTDLIYEIKDIYREDNLYVVEFYAAKAVQTLTSAENECSEFEKSLTYQLKISNLLDKEYYNESYSRCCKYDEKCQLDGIFPLKNEILTQTKINDTIYKMIFTKTKDSFVYHQLRK